MKDYLADCIVFASKLTQLDMINYCYVSTYVARDELYFSAYIVFDDGQTLSYKSANVKDVFHYLQNKFNELLNTRQIQYGYA